MCASQSPDLYDFGPGWGRDEILDGDTTVSPDASSSGGTSDEIYFAGGSSNTPPAVTTDLAIDLATGRAGDGTNSVTWAPPAIERATGGSGDDTIRGSEEPSGLWGSTGNDDINAAGGGKDYVVCGLGQDKATVGPEDGTPEELARLGCETVVVVP